MTLQADLKTRIRAAHDSSAFKNYQSIRDRILWMVEEMVRAGAAPSDYWSEEVAGFDYLFDASPLIIERFREHCYHITGIHSYPYRQHHKNKDVGHTHRYQQLRAIDNRNLFVPESLLLGGFGYEVGGGMANLDTLKFYEVLIGLNKAGLLDTLDEGSTVIEIGAGWGGFAYQMRKLYPTLRYIIIDLPHTMLFSATYLRSAFPDAQIVMHGDSDFEKKLANGNFDIAFVPHYLATKYHYPIARFAVNIASFQEMTSEQVSSYAALLSANGCAYVYSLNRKRSPYNTQLVSVEDELSKYYRCEPIHVLDTPYTSIGKKAKTKAKLKSLAKKMKIGHEDLNYRHIVGRLRSSINNSPG